MILVDLAIIAILAFAAYEGAKRGIVLVGLEFISFVLATIVALAGYHLVGGWVQSLSGTTQALGNVAGFVCLWVVTELACGVFVRFVLLRRLTQHEHASTPSRISGSILNIVKMAMIVALALIVFAGLPLSAAAKQPVTGSHLGKIFLTSTGQVQAWLSRGLGRDLGESLNFFTVTSEAESEERITLGYTTSGPSRPAEEKAMLELINKERTSRGLKALTANTKARDTARAHSVDMFGRGYFSHVNLDGKTPFDRMKAGNVKFNGAGENLALAPTLQLAHQGLMNSPGHKANILSKEYKTVGIGIIDGGQYGLMVTQNFTD